MPACLLKHAGLQNRPLPADGRGALKRALPTTRKMAQSGADRARPGLGRRRAHAPVAAGGDKYGQVKERAFEGAEDAKERVQENGLVQRLVAAHKELTGSGVSVSKLLLTALVCSSTFGFFIQVAHNNGFLPKYDVLQFKVGPALESGVIPLVLAPIWLLYGYLTPLLDTVFKDKPATQVATSRARSLAYVLLTWGIIVAHFLASDYLYVKDFPHWQIYAVLGALWLAIYKAFDNTRQGLLLGVLLFFGAPAGESFIVNVLHLWHYDRPDILGVPGWAGWCYAAYSIGVGNFARYWVNRQREGKAF